MKPEEWDGIAHFERSEWKYEPTLASPELVRRMDLARTLAEQEFGPRVSCHIHCCYDPDGHAPRSLHKVFPPTRPLAEAVDHHWIGLPLAAQFAVLQATGFQGIGFYPFWNSPGWHVDLRPTPTFWWQDHKGEYIYGLKGLVGFLSLSGQTGG